MGLLKLLGKLAVAVVVGMAVLTIVGKVRQAQAKAAPPAANASEAGFVMLKPEEAKNSSVVIMSAPNCPRQEAVRARELAASLQAAGIPHRVESRIDFSFTDMKEAERVQKFMASVENPLVLVRGRGKGNPTLEAVIAEYRSAPVAR
jgi:sulfite reductase alpha subunit-like flavoprotein